MEVEAADRDFCEGLSALLRARELELCPAVYISQALREDTIGRYRGRWQALVEEMGEPGL